MQVVTNENMLEFIENRKVPEFKAPEADKVDAPKKEGAKDETKPEAVKEPQKAEPVRGEDGKFVAQAEVDDEEDDKDLTEKVRRKIGAKHRAMKEAEEFGKTQYLERRAAEERAERLQREIDELKKPKSRPASDEGKPKPEDFKTVEEYADALTDYKVEKKLKERDEQRERDRQQNDAEQVKTTFANRVSQAMKDIPDYEEVTSQSDAVVPPHMAQYIMESEMGPIMAYHFAKHPEVFDRIAKLSPIRAIAELGKVEISLEKKPEPKKEAEPIREVSKAPSPITPIEGKSTSVEKDPAKMSFRELREYERQREAARRAR